MAYADYRYYITTYLGTAIQEADFPRLSLRASSFLDYYTQGRAARNAGLDALKMARALEAGPRPTEAAGTAHNRPCPPPRRRKPPLGLSPSNI